MHRRRLVQWCNIYSIKKYVIAKSNICVQWKILFIGLGVQFGWSFYSILNTVVPGGSISAVIDLRGFVISRNENTMVYFDRSVDVDSLYLYFHFSLNTGQLSYFVVQSFFAIVQIQSLISEMILVAISNIFKRYGSQISVLYSQLGIPLVFFKHAHV